MVHGLLVQEHLVEVDSRAFDHFTQALDTHDALVELRDGEGNLAVLLSLGKLLQALRLGFSGLFDFTLLSDVPDFTFITAAVTTSFVDSALPGSKSSPESVISID